MRNEKLRKSMIAKNDTKKFLSDLSSVILKQVGTLELYREDFINGQLFFDFMEEDEIFSRTKKEFTEGKIFMIS